MPWFVRSRRAHRRPHWWRFTFHYTVFTGWPDRLDRVTFRGTSKIHTVWER
jgi:hypothetical protein